MPAIYALLVGINNYPVNALKGCINDVNAMEDCLQKLYGDKPDIQLNIKRLTDQDEQPTRENIIGGFDFFKTAADNDTCLFYYSGHGSFVKAPEEFWAETDGFLESVVCIDSRIPGGRDLMDKEVGYLIASITILQPGVSFIAITDCCHSGTITRAIAENNIIERTFQADFSPRELKDFYGFGNQINDIPAYDVQTIAGKQQVTVIQGKHIHIAAARDNQTAKELMIDGMQRGAFTYSLLKTIFSTNGLSTYKELIKNIRIQVNNTVADQQPMINLNGGLPDSELNKYFLSASVGTAAFKYMVYWNKSAGWCINAGSIHGVSIGDEVIIEGVCRTKLVDQYAPDFSVLMNKPQLGTPDKIYSATIQINPERQVRISFSANADPLISQEIESVYKKLPPGLIALVNDNSARYLIRTFQKETFICLPGDDLPIFKPIEVTDEPKAAFFLDRVEVVSKWIHLLELNHPASGISKKDYSLTLFCSVVPGDYNDSGFTEMQDLTEIIDFHYQQKNEKWFQPAFRLKITNTGKKDLWINCLFMSFDFSINASMLKEIRLPAGQSTWLIYIDSNGLEQNTVRLKLDKKYAELGYSEITEYLKLFISTDQLETVAFEQDGVELPKKRPIQLKNFAERGLDLNEEDTNRSVDWTTETIGLRIVQSEAAMEIFPGKSTQVNNLILEAHPSLRASFNLTSSFDTSRSADTVPGPNTIHRNSFIQPFHLLQGTRSAIGSDVLELFNVSDKNSVSEADPLVITLPENRPGEMDPVIPMGYDQETKLFYPLGYSTDQNKLVIEKLPDETASDAAITQRSLLGSIKIYFQKVVGKKLGMSYDYPRLATVEITEDLQVKYNHEEAVVKKAVQRASAIFLFIHGIIGDTEGMVKCIKTVLDEQGTTLEKKADLVLSFDYENLHTPIEENAGLLQKRLEAVGLVDGHGKQFIIIAHSMGGLVSRWFIEKMSGNKIVTKLFMFGTPNNGTPWVDVRDMAETFITYGVNGAAFLQPWMVVLSLVGKLAKGSQIAFKQMDIKTGIYDKLNDGTDPLIPYMIISGNTQNIIVRYEETSSLIARLLQKIKKKGAYSALDLLLFKKPNDIAVTVESISTIKNAESWKNKTIWKNAACDHMSYFITKDALKNILA
jgi:hypothetical protein